MKRLIVCFIYGGGIVAAALGKQLFAQDGLQVIHIGLASNFSAVAPNSYNPLGHAVRNGAHLALDVINARLKTRGTKIVIEELDYGTSPETVLASARQAAQSIDPATFDVAFVDKNLDGSAHDGAATIAWLRAHGARRIVLASGERADKLRADPQWASVDAICEEKLPASLAGFVS